ncbi:MAG: hypothetical protein ACYC5O_04130 [Anaerolineae bacterium]
MRRIHRAVVTLSATGAIALALAGCGTSAATPTATAAAAPVMVVPVGQGQGRDTGASQLAIGTFYLEDTDLAVTAEQAAILVPLWQTVQSLAAAESPSQDDLATAQEAVQAAMTEEQLQAIEGMDQGSEEVTALMSSLGVALPTGMPAGGQMPQGTPPAGGQVPQGTPPAGGQDPQGTPPAGDGQQPGVRLGGMGMVDSALLDKLIELLQERAAGA